MMTSYRRGYSMALLASLLTSCGGGGDSGAPSTAGQAIAVVAGGSVSPVPSPTPTPTPTPTQTPTPTPTPDASTTPQGSSKDSDPNRVLLGDRMFYSRGSFIGYASPWCTLYTSKLVVGVDLVNSISLLPSTFPDDTVISTKAPMDNPNSYGCGVYGYVHIAYGNYDSGVPKVAVPPARVSALRSLLVDFAMTQGSSTGEYNVLNEFYLTSAAGDSDSKIVEIGYFLHPSATSIVFAKTGQVIGDHVDPAGRRWRVYKVGKFIMVIADGGADVVSGTLDIKSLLQFLIEKKVITGDEWFNGMAIGVEPVRGQAKVTIDRWRISSS